MLPRQRSGTRSRASSARPSTPTRSLTGQRFSKLISVEWTRFLSADLVLDQLEPKAGQLALFAGSGRRAARSPAPARARSSRPARASRSCRSCGPAARGPSPSARPHLDLPARLLERVVHEPGTADRLDHTANRLPINRVDPPRERPQRIGVRRRGKLIDLSPDSDSKQTSTLRRDRSNPACNVEDGPPLSSLLGDSRSVSPEEALLHGSPRQASDVRLARRLRPGESGSGATARPGGRTTRSATSSGFAAT